MQEVSLIRSRFLTRALAVLAVTAALSTGVFAGSASACQCYPGEQEPQRYARAHVVFTGLLLTKVADAGSPNTPGDDLYRYTFQVGTEYKGDVPATVEVVTTQYATNCGLTYLAVGVDYLVFATTWRDVYQTRTCDGTRLASGGPPVTGAVSAGATAAAAPCTAA